MRTSPDKLAHQKQVRDVERRRNAKRRELFDAQDAIDQQRLALSRDIQVPALPASQGRAAAEIDGLDRGRWDKKVAAKNAENTKNEKHEERKCILPRTL